MEGVKLIPYIALIIAIAGIILGASAIVLSKFGDSMTQCFNSTYIPNSSRSCSSGTNSTSGINGLNLSDAYFTKVQSTIGITTIAQQVPTVAIIAVMVIIISIIAGVFVYMKYFA